MSLLTCVCIQKCCSVLLWSVVSLVIIAAIVITTVVILYLNQYPLPFVHRYFHLSVSPVVSLPMPLFLTCIQSCCHSNRERVSSSSPVITTNPRESGALVTVSRVTDGEPISIFVDPNCPDYKDKFVRWEALQSSLLQALSGHSQGDWQETGLVHRLAEEVKILLGHAHNLRAESESLTRGQGVLEQRLDGLWSEQNRIIQVSQECTFCFGGFRKIDLFNFNNLAFKRFCFSLKFNVIFNHERTDNVLRVHLKKCESIFI